MDYKEEMEAKHKREQEIYELYPEAFGKEFNAFGREISVREKFFPLLKELIVKVRDKVKELDIQNFSFHQLKAKFNWTCIYHNSTNSEVQSLVSNYEAKMVDV
jgi:hypothetical protein